MGWIVLSFAVVLILVDVLVTNTEFLIWFALALALTSISHFLGFGVTGVLLTYTCSFLFAILIIVLRQRSLVDKNNIVISAIPKIGDHGTIIVGDSGVSPADFFNSDPSRGLLHSESQRKRIQPEPDIRFISDKDASSWSAKLASASVNAKTGDAVIVVNVRGFELIIKHI